MKLAIVGKGGSGKSTLSWLLTKRLAETNKLVLAIDADYNMDLASNLGWTESADTNFINHSESDFYTYQDLTDNDRYVDLPLKDNLKPFSLTNKDVFTKKYITSLNENIDLMVCGGAHEDTYYGQRCSHAYFAPLKFYLPWLELKDNQYVIIDSVAGTDMINYGLYLGVDAIICAVEPTPNSKKVALQIKKVAELFSIPLFFVGNKGNPDTVECTTTLPAETSILTLDYDRVSNVIKDRIDSLLSELKNQQFESTVQWKRLKQWRKHYDEQQKIKI